MSIGQAFKLAIKSIVSNKIRSFLTMLGMIIGVGSVIAIMGLMNGVTGYMVSSFADMGSNLVSVSVTNIGTRNVGVDEMYEIVEENPTVFEAVTPAVSASYKVKNGSDSLDTAVRGVGEDYLDIERNEVSKGRFIQYSDILSRINCCVVGTYIVEELYGGTVSLGDTIKINGQLFTIVGIQEELADSEKGSSDDCIYIPYSTAARMANTAVISNYTFSAINTEVVGQVEDILDKSLYSIMKNEDLYYIMSMTEMLTEINKVTGILSMVLAGIAGISLLVAGIGIMNIMLVSVIERTKEIGIRKSLGAKKRDIMRQFVIEAAMISSLGGLIGIILGASGTMQLGRAFGLQAVPSLSAVLVAFGVSAGIGIGFGYMPANKAAKLNPIDALRNE